MGWFQRASLAMLAVVAFCACGPTRHTSPVDGPTAKITVASICVERASFFARINRLRTEEYGCNQTAEWVVSPGTIDFLIQVEQASFTVEPLELTFDIAEDECADFLLRQAATGGYNLEFIGVGACD